MREITTRQIEDAVAALVTEANFRLPDDIESALCSAAETEISPTGKEVLQNITENARIAKKESVPICQDTGMAVFFLEVGQEVHITGTSLEDAVNQGVRRGYTDGFLRASVVSDPLQRTNTGDNTPAIIHTRITSGDRLKISFLPKGFGSENMSRIAMLSPSAGAMGVMDFIFETVKAAGPNPCPPIVVGVGLGGDFEKAALLSKAALMRPVSEHHPDTFYAEMEETLLARINTLGIGPAGMGGTVTALGVNIETYPTHIAGLPVAVNICCHVSRHQSIIL